MKMWDPSFCDLVAMKLLVVQLVVKIKKNVCNNKDDYNQLSTCLVLAWILILRKNAWEHNVIKAVSRIFQQKVRSKSKKSSEKVAENAEKDAENAENPQKMSVLFDL